MELATGAAGARFSHHPEIVLFASAHDMDFRIESCGFENPRPEDVGFLIELSRVTRFGLVYGCVKTIGWKVPSVDQKLPSPFDGFLFEVVPKRPIAEHFEKGMVVSVESNVFEVVVLASGSDALLGVRSSVERSHLIPEKKRYELIHPRIREKKVRRFGQKRSGRHDLMLLGLEEVKKGLSDILCLHGSNDRVKVRIWRTIKQGGR